MAEKPKKVNPIKRYLHKHPYVKLVWTYVGMFFAAALSAFLFYISKKAFLEPVNQEGGLFIQPIVGGGFSGIAQIIELIFGFINHDLFGNADAANLIYSISYWILNIPVFVIAFKFVGKRFAIFTLINVTITSLLMNFLNIQVINEMAEYIAGVVKIGDPQNVIQTGILTRVLLAGLFAGLSSSISLRSGSSGGGFDVISFVIAQKKGTTIGKYNVVINTIIVILYSVLSIISQIKYPSQGSLTAAELIGLGVCLTIFAIVYQFVNSTVIDLINVKNKKVEAQIVTKEKNMADLLMGKFPHSCTILDATGGYTKKKVKVILIVISKLEVKEIMEFVKEVDENAFMNVFAIDKFSGHFFSRPTR